MIDLLLENTHTMPSAKNYKSARYYLSSQEIALIIESLRRSPFATDSRVTTLILKLKGAHKNTGSANHLVQAAAVGMFQESDINSLDFEAINKELGL